MLEAIDAPIELAEGLQHTLSGSVGIAMGDGAAEGTAQEQASLMFRDAELAMYEAKRQEGNSTEVFAPHMHDAVTQRLRCARRWRSRWSAASSSCSTSRSSSSPQPPHPGLRALVRWMHPERGFILTREFIPLAEQTGLIVELGDWCSARPAVSSPNGSAAGRTNAMWP